MTRARVARLGLLCGCALALACAPATKSSHQAQKPVTSIDTPAMSPASASPVASPPPPTASAATVARDAGAAPTAAQPSPGATRRAFAGSALDEDSVLEQLASAPMLSFRPVGSTSTVFKVALKGTISAAFKAATVRRPRGPLAEIAAYRMARCLGLDNVPPAVSRRVPVAQLKAELSPEQASKWPEILASLVTERDGRVPGAAIYWVDGMQNLGLETAEGQAKVTSWLSLSIPLADADRPLAAQLSTLLAFDYLIGNWDRWSGGNLKGDGSAQRVYMRDHDAAFANRLSEPLQRHMLDPLVRAQRFSRSFYRAVRALSRDAFLRELARDPGFAEGAALDAAAVDAVFDRRQTLLSHIMATLEEHGDNDVLVFP